MKNKKGFAFVETIITVVVLSASLLYLYSTYNAIISDEKVRLYYDDPVFIYNTNYVKNFLKAYSEIEKIEKNYFKDTYAITIGTGFEGLFDEEERAKNRANSLEEIVKSFKINQIVLVKSTMFEHCFEGTEEYCKSSINNLSYGMQKYINSLNETTYDYYLVIEYAIKFDEEEKMNIRCTPGIEKKCQTYYASVGLNGEYETTLSDYIISKYNGVQGNNNIYYHNDSLENGANDYSYRYAGPSNEVNNYVCFGSSEVTCPIDNLYRIIGVINGQVKLIKYDYASSNLLGTDGDYAYKSVGIEPYYKGKLSSLDTYYWNNTSAINEKNIWSETKLNTIQLNTNYLNNIGETWAAKIDNTTWKVGGNEYEKIEKSIPSVLYQNEVVYPLINTTYEAKIGLMYASDYGFAASPSAWTKTIAKYDETDENNIAIRDINWMDMGYTEWTISRLYDGTSDGNLVFVVGYTGYVGVQDISDMGLGVRPTFNLKYSTIYISGTGTQSDPIRID